MAEPKIPKQMVEFQRNLVEFQKQAFESTFNAFSAMQDQQRELMSRMLEGSPAVPGEMKQLLDEWARALETGREQFRDTVDRSFETVESYLERLAGEDEGAQGTGGGQKQRSTGKAKGKE
ncbi:MAG TPA: hypothetical protein VHR17_02010 [Thermoanaerobaculia bacterium]|jgi:hypothetical protein|nr:hypothetical protein [Thermoanaerobaculia bacterium]